MPRTLPRAEPVLKWAGGKRRLVEQYASHFPGKFGHYHEPFFGGGAVYFWLWSQGRLQGKSCGLSDINPELVNFYRVLKSQSEALYALLQEHQARHAEEHYYEVRRRPPAELDPVQRAARLLYLNRTCFNGLYRENSRGEFNVPMGRYSKPRIFHQVGLDAARQALQSATLQQAPYHAVEDEAQPGDLVYFDPPYQPLSTTASFTSYTQHDFNEQDQADLASLFHRLRQRKVRVLLSNSDCPLIRQLYKSRGVKQIEIQAARAINSKADRRQKITELLIVG
jgi:DNA adenine methylase